MKERKGQTDGTASMGDIALVFCFVTRIIVTFLYGGMEKARYAPLISTIKMDLSIPSSIGYPGYRCGKSTRTSKLY